ncbi:hypothetical protein SAMN04488127_1856 [Bhargavaea ginsengi]|uniref:Uncharacterized protein n=1 Tax=Bhargavaea ginsengi TaxID=426757 RepID=A0A1H6Z9I7_9BACL|nr:hypothetical protein SAMN04488127_1856 [Bhargavaea ginsengi]
MKPGNLQAMPERCHIQPDIRLSGKIREYGTVGLSDHSGRLLESHQN